MYFLEMTVYQKVWYSRTTMSTGFENVVLCNDRSYRRCDIIFYLRYRILSIMSIHNECISHCNYSLDIPSLARRHIVVKVNIQLEIELLNKLKKNADEEVNFSCKSPIYLNTGYTICFILTYRSSSEEKISTDDHIYYHDHITYDNSPCPVKYHNISANMRRWPDVGLLLGQRRRRWANSKPTLGQRLTLAGIVYILCLV